MMLNCFSKQIQTIVILTKDNSSRRNYRAIVTPDQYLLLESNLFSILFYDFYPQKLKVPFDMN